jgi:hypothetical protein
MIRCNLGTRRASHELAGSEMPFRQASAAAGTPSNTQRYNSSSSNEYFSAEVASKAKSENIDPLFRLVLFYANALLCCSLHAALMARQLRNQLIIVECFDSVSVQRQHPIFGSTNPGSPLTTGGQENCWLSSREIHYLGCARLAQVRAVFA